ncbi:hypothetical protein ABKN59_009850 [Abortiporus biennis]
MNSVHSHRSFHTYRLPEGIVDIRIKKWPNQQLTRSHGRCSHVLEVLTTITCATLHGAEDLCHSIFDGKTPFSPHPDRRSLFLPMWACERTSSSSGPKIFYFDYSRPFIQLSYFSICSGRGNSSSLVFLRTSIESSLYRVLHVQETWICDCFRKQIMRSR